ncbi:MAG TPA: response regulator transcription factor, partial [Verrucomicrobiae bacterium]|nr:response regulator transcription factor [Verrucomicrobiae bacterium]
VMRMRSVLKRGVEPDPHSAGVLTAGPIEIHLESHDVFVAGKRTYLTLTEFRLLADLARARGRVRSRDALLAEVWGYDSEIESRTLDTHVRRLRTKLGGASDWLKTVRGVGYRIEPPDGGDAGI